MEKRKWDGGGIWMGAGMIFVGIVLVFMIRYRGTEVVAPDLIALIMGCTMILLTIGSSILKGFMRGYKGK